MPEEGSALLMFVTESNRKWSKLTGHNSDRLPAHIPIFTMLGKRRMVNVGTFMVRITGFFYQRCPGSAMATQIIKAGPLP